MLTTVSTMKPTTFYALLFIFLTGQAEAAGVKLERLADFDIKQHTISVNIEVEIEGDCLIDRLELEKTFTGLLGVFGFQVAAVKDSQLEFAVSVKGIPSSAENPCGLKVLSMARQVPEIRMLRLSPGSTSTRYRLWTTENIVAASQSEILPRLQEQARKDVVGFTRALSR